MNSDFIRIFLFITALSLDALAAGFIYGADNVRLPFFSVCILSVVSAAVLLLFLLIGNWLSFFLPPRATAVFSFLLLFFLGIVKLFDGTLKAKIRKASVPLSCPLKKLCFSFSNVCFILTVYANPEIANKEDISVLSPKEAVFLGIALSLDSAAAGLGAGFTTPYLPFTLFFSLLLNTAAIQAGSFLGRYAIRRTSMELSWLGGILFIGLAVSRLF